MKVELECEICGKKFEREKGEVNRNKKLNRRTLCSLRCSGFAVLDNIPKEKRYHPENLIQGRDTDEFSQFRLHMKLSLIHI